MRMKWPFDFQLKKKKVKKTRNKTAQIEIVLKVLGFYHQAFDYCLILKTLPFNFLIDELE